MGEEEKKAEEKKPEEKKLAAEEAKNPAEEKKAEEAKPAEKPASEEKKEEKKAEEGKEGKEAPPPPCPPQEIVLKVYMHCEGCAKKVRKCLKGFEGVEDVQTDCKSHKVIVKGEKADPLKVLERVQKKSHRQVELLSPIPKPPAEEKKEEKEVVKVEEKKEEPPQVITVVLRVHMHCEACAQEIRRRIQRMKGVESVEADLTSSQVTVKGVFEPQALVNYVHKRTGKHATIVKQDPEKKEEKPKEESKEEEKKGNEGGGEKEMKEGGDEAAKADKKGEEAAKATEVEEGVKIVELKKNEFYYYYPQYPQKYVMDMYANTYAPQIFSDENPNACSVMRAI
ncbi:Heavy metal-associated domain, HMA [Dillenia turbinata]|uniref:Heavy metal-associated domain, HMA n=1 Tax=Dillenia turbinata TaxID=194707 RepID=A0AAN8UR91_9MAGN